MTFEEKLKRLEEIVEIMRKNQLPLNETLTIFEEGKKLIKELKEEIKNAEERIEKRID